MSARDLIDEAARRYPDVPDAIAQRAINNLEAAGYRLLGPDEVDPVTVERVADAALDVCLSDDAYSLTRRQALDKIRALASGGKQ